MTGVDVAGHRRMANIGTENHGVASSILALGTTSKPQKAGVLAPLPGRLAHGRLRPADDAVSDPPRVRLDHIRTTTPHPVPEPHDHATSVRPATESPPYRNTSTSARRVDPSRDPPRRCFPHVLIHIFLSKHPRQRRAATQGAADSPVARPGRPASGSPWHRVRCVPASCSTAPLLLPVSPALRGSMLMARSNCSGSFRPAITMSHRSRAGVSLRRFSSFQPVSALSSAPRIPHPR